MICPVCGKTFEQRALGRGRKKIYCSRTCQTKKKTKSSKLRVCPTCGKTFERTSKRHEYCSDECRGLKTGDTFICSVCGKEETYIKWQHRTGICRDCTNKRFNDRKKEYMRNYHLDVRKPKMWAARGFNNLVKCERCRKEFVPNRIGKKYCGCHKEKEIRTCVECGKEFEATRFGLKNLCSPLCKYERIRKGAYRLLGLEYKRKEWGVGESTNICECCGKTFLALDHRPKFCSPECWIKRRNEKRKEKAHVAVSARL